MHMVRVRGIRNLKICEILHREPVNTSVYGPRAATVGPLGHNLGERFLGFLSDNTLPMEGSWGMGMGIYSKLNAICVLLLLLNS